MKSNLQLIQAFYTAFQQKDYKIMQSCYAENAVFSDPVFASLKANEVRAMWEMFCKNGKDLSISINEIKQNAEQVKASWTATYLFTATNKSVTNTITATFDFENGLISKHIDHFDFYKWARQAFGFKGLLLGWTAYFKKLVQKQALKSLYKFMERK